MGGPSDRPLSALADAGRTGNRSQPDRLSSYRLPLIGFALAVAGAAFAVFIDRRVESVLQTQLRGVLTVTLDTAVAGIVAPLRDAVRAARACAADPRIQQVLACSRACDAELGATALSYLREGGFAGVDVADRSGRLRPGWLASAGLSQLPAALTGALSQRSNEPVLTSVRAFGTAWTFVLVRVPDADGLSLVFRLPLGRWSAPLEAARPGESGETYAFDRSGRMISSSRHVANLTSARASESDTRGPALGLELRDPGGNLTQGHRPSLPAASQPYTRAVAATLKGGSGVTLQPYRDYRGVLVVGAYRYLPEFGLGLVCEVDRGTAFAPGFTLKLMLEWLICAFLLTALVLLGAAVLALRMRRRMQMAERLVARFGQYRLVRKIGEGGMGAVYLASHEMLRRSAAIKLLRPERASPEAIARFEREVRVTATLKHPNTVAVYDYGRTERGDLFYVMEYLDGLDLERLVERFGPMPSARVIHYLRQLCGSLAEAHAAKLVHRDIKPANLLACRVGGVPDTLKVVDFGVAKPLTGEALGLTVDRVLLGTPEYMAPELFESSERATPQSDLYSAGAVAYFLLTGQPVFEVQSLTELCLAQLTRAPEPPSVRLGAEVDPQLEAAILACLAKRAEARPVSARALSSMLDRSKQANAWKVADAEAWWNRHADELHEVRTSREPAQPSPEFTQIQPQAATLDRAM